ncbi:uncharacterized protein METZ01_LOCUS239977 [marine metagenome]|uniref:Uncharacterized protein n=1 Tax=marine metagenome TaxID=408172 RepID=A0A382HKC9_9ZZZZ
MSNFKSLAWVKALRQDDRLGATHRTNETYQDHYR